jgi:AraC-like DNA-binding protein
MSTKMVRSITPRIVINECVQRRVSREKLMEEVGISRDSISEASSAVPVEKMYLLWERAVSLTGDNMLGLHVAEKIPFGAFRLLDYIFAASATPKDALVRTGRSFAIMNSAFIMSLRCRRGLAFFELHSPGDPGGLPRAYIEYIFANYIVRLRFMTQRHCRPLEVHVTYRQPAEVAEYDRFFGARWRFGQNINCLVFPEHVMDTRHPLADPELCELLENYAQGQLRHTVKEGSTLMEIRRALAYNLERGNCTLTFLSRELGKSCRSLQREIQANGMTFRELLDNLRLERASMLLKERLPITEVAMKLNFADTSSFCRAFHRWSGQSPLNYRRATSAPSPAAADQARRHP